MSLVPKSNSQLPLFGAISRKSSGSKHGDSKPAPSRMLKKLNKDDLKTVRSHTELAKTANGVRMLTKNLAMATIQLHVRAIMIVTKARDNSLIYLTREIVEWILNRPDDITIYVDYNLRKLKRFDVPTIFENHEKAQHLLKFWKKDHAAQHPEDFDLVVTLGGDGTVLYVLNLFQRVVPPVMSFALGSLGFLTNFRFEQFRKRMTSVLDTGVKAYMRMRFTCRVHDSHGKLICEQQVLNELVVDRGPSPYVTNLELYGDGSLLTVAQADGLIIATPTGSTAYSLSAGGSLVHPGVSAISVTPICPHTLSFRPILLPDGMFLKVKVPSVSRATAWASFDGKVRTELRKGYYVTVQASPFPFPTVRSSKTEYFDSVSRNLNWNAREQQKPFSHFLTGTTKSAFELSHNGDELERKLADLHVEEDFDIDYSDKSDTSSEACLDHDDAVCLDYDHVGPFIPLPGSGINTPPNHYSHIDNRTCYAHPNAVILLLGDSSNSDETETDSLSRLEM
ncbi:CIC11C00000003746 [Sungouiella intermedia]|uniref:CIC11C00000003746 n=1 Tax=Sungouiella intermedia TaxID=45354 RepID=A0A1L0BF97_9ASCO|nr:CIC11C00000003746 [[Candida] intermedia]